jgi:hypothetical protein
MMFWTYESTIGLPASTPKAPFHAVQRKLPGSYAADQRKLPADQNNVESGKISFVKYQ